MKTKLFLSLIAVIAAFTVAQEVQSTPMHSVATGVQHDGTQLSDMVLEKQEASSSAVKVGGISALFVGSGVAAYKYKQHISNIKNDVIQHANALSALENEGGSTGVIKLATPAQPAIISTPAQTGRFAQCKQVVSQFGSEMKEATRNNVMSVKSAMTNAKSACTLANAKSAMTVENAKAALTSPAAKLAGLSAFFIGSGVAAYKYNQHLEAQAEATRLANRSYARKFMDGVSYYAQSAKANTWDSNYGFNHSGKVATVAGVAAVAGLSYLAYKKNPFGRAVVKTVERKVPAPTTRKLSAI